MFTELEPGEIVSDIVSRPLSGVVPIYTERVIQKTATLSPPKNISPSFLKTKLDSSSTDQIDLSVKALWRQCFDKGRALSKGERSDLKTKMAIAYCAVTASVLHEGTIKEAFELFARECCIRLTDLLDWIQVREFIWSPLREHELLECFLFEDLYIASFIAKKGGPEGDVEKIFEGLLTAHRAEASSHLEVLKKAEEFFSQYDGRLLPGELFQEINDSVENVTRKFRAFRVKGMELKLQSNREE